MILVIADPLDPLANQFTAHYGGRVLRATEPELLTSPFSLEIDHAKVNGRLTLHDQTIALDDLTAIFLRPIRSESQPKRGQPIIQPTGTVAERMTASP